VTSNTGQAKISSGHPVLTSYLPDGLVVQKVIVEPCKRRKREEDERATNERGISGAATGSRCRSVYTVSRLFFHSAVLEYYTAGDGAIMAAIMADHKKPGS
jgi:hypothetical protein